MPGRPRRAAIYARVSTDKQDVERQLADLREYAFRSGYDIVEVVVEEESGNIASRSGLSRLQRLAHRRKIDVVLVTEMSRLTRRGVGSVFEILRQFGENGVEVVSQTEPFLSTSGPARELLLAIFAWVSRQERETISDRTRSALRQRRALGVRLGAEPLCKCGHRRKGLRRDGGRLVHCPACTRCACGGYSPRPRMTGGLQPTSTHPTPG